MYFLPNCPKPCEDELLLSWLCRTAEKNAMTFNQLIILIYGNTFGTAEIQRPLQTIFKRVRTSMWPCQSISELFLKTTLFPFYSFQMTREQQTRYVYSFMSDKNYVPKKRGLFCVIKVCPECLKEDKMNGGCYLHRAHQAAGVCVCHKHGCLLWELPVKSILNAKDSDEMYDSENFVECAFSGNLDEEAEYAKCVYELLNVPLNIDLSESLEFLDKALKDKGYANGLTDPSFIEDYNLSSYSHFGSKLTHRSMMLLKRCLQNVMVKDLLPMVMFAYDGDVSMFIKEGRSMSCKEVSVPDNLELLHSEDLDSPVKFYRCKECGEYFICTDWGIENGMLCPECCDSEAEFYESMVKALCVDEYELAEEIHDKYTPVRIKHEICEEYFSARPIDFVFNRKRCKCHIKISFKEASARVAKVSNFTLEKYKNIYEKAVIRHTGGCGKSFECLLWNFLHIPSCRICEGRMNNDDFAEQISALVGNEYTAVSEFKTWHKPVRIRHSSCGKEFGMDPANFLQGNRCPYCAKVMVRKYLAELVDKYTSGHYRLSAKNTRKDFEDVEDTVAGKTMKLTKQRIKQEIFRPTPSDILVLSAAEEDKRKALLAADDRSIAVNDKEKIYSYLRDNFSEDDLIFTDELEESGFLKDVVKSKMRLLCNEGRIRRITVGVYVFPNNEKQYTAEEILYNKYVCRNGKVIGELLKAGESGYKEDRYISIKFGNKGKWRIYSFAGVKILGKGM